VGAACTNASLIQLIKACSIAAHRWPAVVPLTFVVAEQNGRLPTSHAGTAMRLRVFIRQHLRSSVSLAHPSVAAEREPKCLSNESWSNTKGTSPQSTGENITPSSREIAGKKSNAKSIQALPAGTHGVHGGMQVPPSTDRFAAIKRYSLCTLTLTNRCSTRRLLQTPGSSCLPMS